MQNETDKTPAKRDAAADGAKAVVDENVRLSDVVDLRRLQRLQDAFAGITRITTVVIGPNGEQLTQPSNLHGVCALMQGAENGLKKCIVTNTCLCEQNRKNGEEAVLVCPHSGLLTAAVPLIVDGKHLGSWIVGQARVEDAAPGLLQATADELGMDAQVLQEAMEGLPCISRQSFDEILEFLKILSQSVVRMGYVGARIARNNEELGKLTGKLDATAQMLRKFVDSSSVGMYVCDFHTGEMLMANKQYCADFGVTQAELVGQPCWKLSGKDNTSFCGYCPRERLLDENGRPGEPYVWENYNPLINVWLRCTNQAIYWVDGRLAHMVTYLDVSDEHKMREELAQLAYFDKQMAMPNSLKLQQDLREEQVAQGHYLLCYDIGSLRRVNDVYGRETGDRLLAVIAEWVNQQQYGSKMHYRIDGDEFCLLFAGMPEEYVMEVAQKIMARFQEAWVLKIQEQYVSVICGIYVAAVNLDIVHSGESILTIIERTLDLSRASGEVAVYDEAMDKASRESTRMEMSLKNCVKNGMQGFDVFYQPIVDPAAGMWKALEALCRWTDPETGKPVSPLVFIAKAEQVGLIRQIGFWVLETAVRQCKAWKLDEVEGFFLSVNLSPNQVMDEGLVEKVTGLLRSNDFPGRCLNLEVTESTEFTFNMYSINVIDNLRFRGVRFALDDFGTGYSSFNNLKNLPVSLLKTEREFIKGIEEDNYMQYFFYTLAELAHAADMKLIAEGIETREQLEIIMKNGADYIQGYYFSKPLPARELDGILEKFVQVDPSFYSLRGSSFTEEKIFSGKDAYMISPTLFKLLNKTMQTLLSPISPDEAYAKVLEQVGTHLDAARTYVFIKTGPDTFSSLYEWCAPGVEPEKQGMQEVKMALHFPSWLPALERDGMIVANDIAKLPMDIYDELLRQGVKSTVVLGMTDGGVLTGFLGVDSARYHEWLPEEITLLRNLSMTMASTRKRNFLQEEVQQNRTRFSDVLNSMDLLVVVSDAETDEILWANDQFIKTVGADGIAGWKCHELVYDKATRCEFCPVPGLLESGDGGQCSWEFYNPKLERYFMIHNSLVRWSGDKKVNLEYAVDITEVKQAQKQLEYFASTDTLTGAANRSSLLASLRLRLQEAHQMGWPLSVVFVDIDKLKYANDTYGHSFGDELIKATVQALRSAVRGNDIIGRHGGDEFIVVLSNCGLSRAEELMEKARAQMASLEAEPYGGEFSFSYGVVENSELPLEDSDKVLDAILNLADDRMRDYKKMYAARQEAEKAAANELAGTVQDELLELLGKE